MRQSCFGIVDYKAHGIRQYDGMVFSRKNVKRINNRGGIKGSQTNHFPNMGNVAVLHIEWRGDERKRNYNSISEKDIKNKGHDPR